MNADCPEAGNVCLARLQTTNAAGATTNSHFFIVDGWDGAKSGFARYLVCDSDGGAQKSMADTMSRRGFPADAAYLTRKYKLS